MVHSIKIKKPALLLINLIFYMLTCYLYAQNNISDNNSNNNTLIMGLENELQKAKENLKKEQAKLKQAQDKMQYVIDIADKNFELANKNKLNNNQNIDFNEKLLEQVQSLKNNNIEFQDINRVSDRINSNHINFKRVGETLKNQLKDAEGSKKTVMDTLSYFQRRVNEAQSLVDDISITISDIKNKKN